MRDCVIVGCGRSGTSLAAGLLARAGYNCGDDLLPPDEGGPTGFFEARRVNQVNEALLAAHDEELPSAGYSRRLRDGERWLAIVPPDVNFAPSAALRDAMAGSLPRSPYCCKDPRFGYTLDAWRPVFGGALFVCVFRHPLATARSIARDVRYGDLTVDVEAATEIWKAVYRRVLDRLRHQGDWLFVHYEQLLDGSGVDRLSAALGVRLDQTLADPALNRSRATEDGDPGAAAVYSGLCELAGHPA